MTQADKLLFIIFFVASNALSQDLIPIGTWRSHFNYSEATHVFEAGNKIYYTTLNGLVSFNREDNSLTRITKVNGLNDVGISALVYNPATDKLIIGYDSGNIDVIDDEGTLNFDLILKAEITGSRRINAICTAGTIAYLATAFGVVVIEVEDVEVKETYENLGPAGQKTEINDCTIFEGVLHLATQHGVISGDITGSVNLLNFQNWERYSSELSVATGQTDLIIASNSGLIATNEYGLFLLEGEEWRQLDFTTSANIQSMGHYNSELFLVLGNEVINYSINDGITTVINYTDSSQAASIAISDDGMAWIADTEQGLFKEIIGGFENLTLSGPISNNGFKLLYNNGLIIILPGGFTRDGIPLDNIKGYSIFEDGNWGVFNLASSDFGNLTAIAANPQSGNLTIGSFGDGIIDVKSQVVFSGVPFQASALDPTSIQISGLDYDSHGNLWVANHNSTLPLHRLDPSGNWESFSFQGQSSEFPLSLTINDLDDIWMILNPAQEGGILVYNADIDQQRFLSTQEGFGNLPNLSVTDVEFDREGQAWIGTERGIAFMPNSFNIFDDCNFDVIRPFFENRTLLKDEWITAIAIDGGNRKWIGTNNGLWLFEEFGEKLVFNFTVLNSPLPSNQILDIAINPQNGEVFISTSKGIVSYRGTATESALNHKSVRIFPNPIRPDYAGIVGIYGLVEDASIKITGIGGRVIFEIEASGGTAVWNVHDFHGNRTSFGVYLVFSSSKNGEEAFVGKIAII